MNVKAKYTYKHSDFPIIIFIYPHVAVKIIRGEILDNLYSLVLIKRGFLQRNKLLCPTVMFDNYVEH